ncbi:MAG: ParB/RepB/Spo0J family partition protein [Flavobacteriales bacterium]|nr:ParB/RepB/Spo0J family partition protein [Flavobacteriales bacterium]MCB9447668.1 ParB/RepB/Spo0J family partition protein [Flavobacteriales bacterium]
MSGKRNALGKGLSALLENAGTDITTGIGAEDAEKVVGAIARIRLDQIEVNPFQPRSEFDQEKLDELAASIKEHDIIQPVTVRKLGYDKYQLISGERRLRAAQIAGLTDIPAYIRVANDQSMLEIALVENIQRENLDPIEVAISCKRLVDECKLTQEEVSEKLGKKRSTVANYLRLLNLPIDIQQGIREGKISMGHARAIAGVPDAEQQMKLFQSLLSQQISVREAEDMARKAMPKKVKGAPPPVSFEMQKLKEELRQSFGTKAQLSIQGESRGKITLPFKTADELESLLKKLGLA